jgi:hypothetical protein
MQVAEETPVSVRYKTGSKPYRDELRASLQALGARGPRLTELVARDLQRNGARPRRAWRDAAELSDVADATIERYASQVRHLARDFTS